MQPPSAAVKGAPVDSSLAQQSSEDSGPRLRKHVLEPSGSEKPCPAKTARCKEVQEVTPGTRPLRRPSQPDGLACHVSLEDLDDLHPHLMYGAVASFLKALMYSLEVIAPAILSWQNLAMVVTLAVLSALLVPLQTAAFLFLLAEGVFALWLRSVRQRLNQHVPLLQRLPSPIETE
ncbi:unnamed protein product, partial [Polarella glacialis]